MYRPDVVVMAAGSADDALDFLRFAPGAEQGDGRPVIIFYSDTPTSKPWARPSVRVRPSSC